jgi:hypothetical protein
MGVLTAIMSASTSLGATLLSVTLAQTGTFNLFLVIVGTAVFAGSVMLLMLGRSDPRTP